MTDKIMNTSEAYRNTYRQEAEDLIADIETTLLDIEKNPGDTDLLNRIFRDMHTIKGSGAMFGFDDISDFAHHLETVLDRVCKGIIPVTEEIIDLILTSLDQIKSMLAGTEHEETAVDQKMVSRIVAAFNAMLPEQEEDISDNEQKTGFSQVISEEPDKTYHIEFHPDPDIYAYGMDPLLLLDELRDLGLCMVETHSEKIPDIRNIKPEQCYLFWDFTLTTSHGADAIKEVFLFVEETSEINIQEISEPTDKGKTGEMEQTLLRLCERLLETGYITDRDLKDVISNSDRISGLLIDAGVVSHEEVKSGLHVSKLLDREKETVSAAESIRVPVHRIDQLVNLIGELTITQQRLAQITSSAISETRLRNTVKTAKRLTGELRNCILSIRMIPIGTTFSKFRRYVRDTSNELGKEIELITEGEETELDKTIIEHLGYPLVHLIRNSIDHGIEMPDERIKAGKSSKGTILLSATHQGSNVGITIEDDGAGINPAHIRTKAVEKGLIPPGADLSEKEIFALLFEPGFSTSEAVTSISGRGVGMDIVKRAIDSLRGTIRINSNKGKGTIISLSLPLTLAIIEGLLVKSGESFFILPIDIVDECIELTKDRIEKARSRNMTWVREELVSFIRLREIFSLPGKKPSIEQIVITRTEDYRTGIVVDEVIGEHQTVVKSLGKLYHKEEWISGATIMGDGAVVLILDVPGLIHCANQESEKK